MKKGYILIDVLIAVLLISIVGESILDGYFNTMKMRNKLNSKIEIYEVAENQLEDITSAAYNNGNYEEIKTENVSCSIIKIKYSERLNKYEVRCKDEENEVVFEKILTNKGFHID